MVKVIEKYYCDRCGKETDNFHHSKFDLIIKRFKSRNLLTIWNADRGRYEPSALCKACAESFDEWWKGGR